MRFKKLFLCANLIGLSFNASHVFAQDATRKSAEPVTIKDVFTKLSNKEPLTKDEVELLEKVRNYSLGSLGGLTFFYLVPPVGFGVIGLFLAKAALGVAGGYGLVELSKHWNWDSIKQSVNEMFDNEDN